MKEFYLLLFIVTVNIDLGATQTTPVRLAGVGSNATSGRVEVFYNGVWGTICDDGFESAYEASVICKMLNKTNRGTVVNSTVFGQGTGPILMDDLLCDGVEKDIAECRFRGWNVSDCTHAEDVGVICEASNLVTTSAPAATTKAPPVIQPSNCSTNNSIVRLKGPEQLNGVGFVEVYINNQWGSVCDDLWGMDDAKVVCGMLCYDRNEARAGAPVEVDYVRNNVSLVTSLDDVECAGTESNILNCAFKSGSTVSQNCVNNRDQFASVTCVNLINAPPADPLPVLECEGTYITASFSRIRDPSLEEKHLTLANNSVSCPNLQKRTDANFVTIAIPFGGCGTATSTNETHITYNNTIRYDYTTQTENRVRVNRYNVEVSCIFERELNADKDMQPQTQYVTQKSPGEFKINMLFYKNNSFVHAENTYPLQLTLGEWLNVGLYLESIGANLKLVVPDCKATPTNDANDPVNYPIFENKCANDPTLAFFPLNSTAFGYRYQTFKFVDYDNVILHCKAFVCVLDEQSATCDRSCNSTSTTTTAAPAGGRRKREATQTHHYIHVTSPPLIFHKKTGTSDIQREWDMTDQVGKSSSVYTVPMTVTTISPTLSTTRPKTSSTNSPTTRKQTTTTTSSTTTTTTTSKPTTTTKRSTTTTTTPTKTSTTPTTTTTTFSSETKTSTIRKSTSTPSQSPSKYTTRVKVEHVTEKTTPASTSLDENNQSGKDNDENEANKVNIKTTSKPSDSNIESNTNRQKIDFKDEIFAAGGVGKPFSQSPPMFSLAQTLISLSIMFLSLVLLR